MLIVILARRRLASIGKRSIVEMMELRLAEATEAKAVVLGGRDYRLSVTVGDFWKDTSGEVEGLVQDH
jgi:hypothetical protein